MTFLPVAQRELLAASRQRLTFRVRAAAGLLAVVVGFFGLLFSAGVGRSVGAPLFHSLVTLAALASALAGLILSADAIAGERREGTLGFLFLTELSSFDVLAGKLVGAGLGAATALLAVFPVLAIGLILGGVTAGEFWRNALVLVNLLWVAVAVGLAASTPAATGGEALFKGGLRLLLLAAGLPLAGHFARANGGSAGWDWIWALGPLEPFVHASDGYFATRPGLFWRSLLESHLVGWGFLALAAWRLPRVWRDPVAECSPLPRTAGWRPTRRLGDAQNPLTALNRPTQRELALVWTVVALTLLVVGVRLGLGQPGWTLPFWGSLEFSLGFLVLKWVFAWRGCVFFNGLRHGSGELLLTTPLREFQLLSGGWAAARSLVQGPLTLLLVALISTSLVNAYTAAGAQGNGPFGQVLTGIGSLVWPFYLAVGVVVDVVALGWLSARFGVRSKGPMAAFGKTLGLLYLPRLIPCIPDLLSAAVILVWARGYLGRSYPQGLKDLRIDPELGLRDAVRGG
jgi:hypothetical protein